MSLNGLDKNIMTCHQQLLITMCCSVKLLYAFVYILRVDMLDVEEIPYSPLPRDVEPYYGKTNSIFTSHFHAEVKRIYAAYLVICNVLSYFTDLHPT